MTNPPAWPSQVEAYLAELDLRLGETDPATRADTLQGVREHLHDALAAVGPDPTAAQVQAILDRLGTVEDVAGATETSGRSRRLAGGWVAPVVLLLQVVGIVGSIFLLPVVALVAAGVLVGLSALWKPWEKVASVAASVVGAVTFVVVVAGAMFAANDCYDTATGQGMDAADKPIEGLRACGEASSSVNVGGVLLVGLGALAAVALVVLAVRAARRVDREG